VEKSAGIEGRKRMTPNRPPRIATWLLNHFGSGDNDALLGDLAEDYRQKNSALWYWRQTLKAIPVSFFREVRAHKGVSAGALLTGWILWIVGGALVFPLVFAGTNLGYAFVPSDPIGSAASFMWMPVLGGFQRDVSFAFATALPLLVGAACGWLVARWQISTRTHPPAIALQRVPQARKTGVVLLFAGSILLIDCLFFWRFVVTVAPDTAYVVSGRLAANVIASLVGIILGGGLLRGHARVA
jgi:hypothetical protein